MSKSKGNTVDPVEVIESIGCDGFRFALASLITYGGQDIKLAPDKLELGKVFGNKIWNASRFVMMNLDGVDDQPIQPELLSVMDQWILARYFQVTELANQNLNEYKFGELAGVLYEFTWNSFCDWYVEFAKSQLKDETRSANTKRILLFVLDGILRLLHPVMPYITEEIWLKFPHRRFESIMVSPYPQSSDVQHLVSNRSTESIDFVLDVVRSIRNIRQQFNVPHPTAINVTLESPEKDERHAIEAGMPILRHFIKLEAVDVHEALSGKPTHAAANVVGHTRILVPLEGLIDVELETKRLQKKSDSLTKEQDQLYRLMSNQEFLEKAPPEVITKNKDRLAEINKQLKLLKEQLVSLL
jgi:valyl-tRNA synthetase